MANNIDSDTKQTDCRIGVCFHPRWARWLANPKLMTACYSFVQLLDGMTFFHFIGTMTTFEKHFQLKSEALGQLLAMGEFPPIVVSLVLSCYSRRVKDRPRWIGCAMLITALGTTMCALPYFLFGAPKETFSLSNADNHHQNISSMCIVNNSSQTLENATAADEKCVDVSVSDQGTIAIAILFLGSTLKVCGNMVTLIIGTPYLDDNVAQKNSAFHLSIVAALRTLGPICGFLICSLSLSFYVNPTQTGIKPGDPQWLGAWWMGYVIIGPLTAIGGFLIFQFPIRLPSTHDTPAVQLEMSKNSSLVKDATPDVTEVLSLWARIINTVKDLFHQLSYLLRNKHWMLRASSAIITMFSMEGYMIFLPKYLEQQFHLTPPQASFWTGTTVIAPIFVGSLCLGVYMKYCLPQPRRLTLVIGVLKTIFATLMLAQMFISCSSAYIVGSHTSSGCDINCECPSLPFRPVCVDGYRNFLSACHAGCSSANISSETILYDDCTCANDNIATSNFCGNSCPGFPYYILLSSLGHLLVSLDGVAQVIFLFRCVDIEKKALSMGVLQVCLSLFAFMPAPLIYSSIIDSTCMLWNKSCDEDGACLLYDIDSFRYLMHGVPVAVLLIACICDFIFAIKANEIDLYGDESKPPKSVSELD